MRVSPLAEWTDAFAALPRIVRLAEVPFCVQLNLRLAAGGPAAQRVGQVLGGPLPTEPSTAKRYDTRDVLWLGPNEWLVLAEAVGLTRQEVLDERHVLPGVRFAVDSYVHFCRTRSWTEGAGAALTELFAPDLMETRIAVFRRHYPWIDAASLEYFRNRVPRATRDADEALAFVVEHAKTPEQKDACVRALVDKCRILWALLDAVAQGAP